MYIVINTRKTANPVGSESGYGWVQVWIRLGPSLDPVGSRSGSGWVQVLIRLGPSLDRLGPGMDPTHCTVENISVQLFFLFFLEYIHRKS